MAKVRKLVERLIFNLLTIPLFIRTCNNRWVYLKPIKSNPLKRAIPLDKSFVPSGLVVTDENENNFHNFVDPNFKPMIKDFVFDYFNSFNESAILDGYNYIIDSLL